jgi:WD40 repeat protein
LILQTVEKTNQQAKVYLSRWDASQQKMTHYCEVDRRARHIASLEEKLVAMSTVTSNIYYPEVLVYDLQAGKLVRTLIGHNGATRDAKFSNNGEWLATLEQTGPVRLWNLKRPETQPAAKTDE